MGRKCRDSQINSPVGNSRSSISSTQVEGGSHSVTQRDWDSETRHQLGSIHGAKPQCLVRYKPRPFALGSRPTRICSRRACCNPHSPSIPAQCRVAVGSGPRVNVLRYHNSGCASNGETVNGRRTKVMI